MSRRSPTTYHLQRAWRLWAWLCLAGSAGGGLLWLAVFGWLTVDETLTSDQVGPPCCLLLFASVALLFLGRYARRLLLMRLTVSNREVDYRNGSTTITVPWTAVQTLCVVKWHQRWLYDGLWVQPSSAAPQGIPVALFDADWPQGTLAATIQRYAPHVFAGPSAPPTPAPPPPRRRRRKGAPVAPPADPGDTRIIPPAPVYNRGQPDPPPDPPGQGVDTIRF